jgi:hypothetical protein
VTEKNKNDPKRKRPSVKIPALTCGFLLLMCCLLSSLEFRLFSEKLKGGFGIGPGLSDFCTGFDWLHYDFKVSGRVVNTQGQPVQKAQVEIGSEGAKSCSDELSSYHVLTNENGEFLFGPDTFEYEKEFFISVSIEGCPPSILYDDQPDSEPVTIVLDCAATSTK